MGCGLNRLPGYVNVDASPACEPDEVWDLEQTPWPWASDSASEVQFIHALEHMGGEPKVFLAIMSELYRICSDGAEIRIHVPHPRHDSFLSDPTHVRPIIPATLELFDRRLNEEWAAKGGANTPLALYTGVDFVLKRTSTLLAEPWHSQFHSGELTAEQIGLLVRTQNNIAAEYRFELVTRKS